MTTGPSGIMQHSSSATFSGEQVHDGEFRTDCRAKIIWGSRAGQNLAKSYIQILIITRLFP